MKHNCFLVMMPPTSLECTCICSQAKKTTILRVIAKLKVKLSSYRKSSLRGNNFTQTFSACYNNRLIQATILNNIFTVVSLYAPNNNDPALCHTFSLKYLILLETSTAFDTVLNTLIAPVIQQILGIHNLPK